MDIQDVEDTEEVDRTPQRERARVRVARGELKRRRRGGCWCSSAALYLSIHSWSLLT